MRELASNPNPKIFKSDVASHALLSGGPKLFKIMGFGRQYKFRNIRKCETEQTVIRFPVSSKHVSHVTAKVSDVDVFFILELDAIERSEVLLNFDENTGVTMRYG